VNRQLLISLLLGAAACGGGGGDEAPDAHPSTSYGGDRPVDLQTPAITPGEQYPLVMVLHGYGASGLIQTAYFQLTDLPDEGIFLLSPDGTIDANGNRFWDASEACCGADGPEVDDVAYLGGLIDAVMADWPIDPARVYVVGHSNGHFMAYRLACERADVITAIAGLAGAAPTVDGSGCDPAQPVSSLHIHGTADSTIPYAGGTDTWQFPGAVATTDIWQAKDHCATTRTTLDPIDLDHNLEGAETIDELADGCPSGIDVELWTVEGGEHLLATNPDFGDRLTAWLLAHPRR